MGAGMSEQRTTDGAEPDEVAPDIAAALALIHRLVAACPQRQACSESERRAHRLVAAELEALGLATEWSEFRFSKDLYSVLALHFGVGTLGSLLSGRAPLLASALHLLSAGSYWADATHRAELLRRLRPTGRSQNLLATLPASAPLQLRIVIPAHIDAAPTGWLFHPEVVRRLSRAPAPEWLSILDRPLALVTYSQLALAGLDGLQWISGRAVKGTGWLRLGLTLPGLIATLVTAEVAHRGKVVPGANDDLSGVAAALALAGRLQGKLPSSVEIVIAITGAEEAGLGGARALAASGRWDPACTVVLGLDTLCGGQLRYLQEGELTPVPVSPWLEQLLHDCIAREPRFAGIRRFSVPAGHTDVYAFLRRGFDGVCLSSIDPELGSARHYHLPSDTPEHLEPSELELAVDFAERVVWTIVEERVSRGAKA